MTNPSITLGISGERSRTANDKFPMTNKSINPNGKIYNIKDRSLDFAVRTEKMISNMPKNFTTFEYYKQLIRSSSSVGANIEEADGTLTKKDFVNKMAIGRREARESRYWLRLILSTGFINDPSYTQELFQLSQEAEEIMLILSSIINKTK